MSIRDSAFFEVSQIFSALGTPQAPDAITESQASFEASATLDEMQRDQNFLVFGDNIEVLSVDEFGEVEDMKEKLSWYLAHDNDRENVAKAGYERGRKQHTFTARINQIFNSVRKTL